MSFQLIGYKEFHKTITITHNENLLVNVVLIAESNELTEVVISGTQKETSKLNSPIPVEVYNSSYFKKNPTPSIFEALSIVNGVQPQLNCNVCNTGDIHINGMEGPYTMVLIDGMPIVSSLATVYGLSGIPNSIIKRIEVVKGPASTLYGSEAVGGLINIITKEPDQSPKFSLDASVSGIGEFSKDFSVKVKKGKISSLLALNGFWFNSVRDINNDNFTDMTLQKRGSIFNKIIFSYKPQHTVSIALRYLKEDRWGGEKNWSKTFRGGDSIYGESIYTDRFEIITRTDLPFRREKVLIDASYNFHKQDSYYGTVKYYAIQHTSFAQLRWDKKWSNHDLLFGIPCRFIYYDDNTPGTQNEDSIAPKNMASITLLPGLFIQDEISLSNKTTLLAGLRYDHHNEHGSIYTPRVSLKHRIKDDHVIRLSGGNGFRVVNLFTEDHAALTGARKVVVAEKLKPERSWNVNINYSGKVHHKCGFIEPDLSVFYTYFTNKIVADYASNSKQIIYDNIKGYAISKGITLNIDFSFTSSVKIKTGATIMDVYQKEIALNGGVVKKKQMFAPTYSGIFVLSYSIPKINLVIDLSSNWKGPMLLPIVPNDFRPDHSPWFALVNIQLSKKLKRGIELYGGLKNVLNFVPKYPILRADDPFNKNILVNNPNAYSFDPSYNYAPIQGVKVFFGVRYTLQ